MLPDLLYGEPLGRLILQHSQETSRGGVSAGRGPALPGRGGGGGRGACERAPPPLQSEVRKDTGAGWNTGQEPTLGS